MDLPSSNLVLLTGQQYIIEFFVIALSVFHFYRIELELPTEDIRINNELFKQRNDNFRKYEGMNEFQNVCKLFP